MRLLLTKGNKCSLICELDLLKQDAWDPRHGLHGRREQAAVSINDIFEPVSIKTILAIMMQPYWYE